MLARRGLRSIAPPDLAAAPIAVEQADAVNGLVTDAGLLSFISTTTVFGTPRDITLSELALEAFFPANAVREGRRSEASPAQPGTGVLQSAAALPCRHGGLRYGPLLGT